MKKRTLLFLALIILPAACSRASVFRPVAGFSPGTNAALEKFLMETRDYPGRKVAVFDGDGTVLGQVPHYLADECLYREAQRHPRKRPDVIRRMVPWPNVSIPYVKHRVHFFEGDTAESLRELGRDCFSRFYKGKIFRPMKDLIALLRENGFEVWIVSASPELMYQKFLGEELGIPVTHVIGVKSVIHGGIITGKIVEPVPQDEGKKEAIETIVQERPLFAAGNSRGDREMIEYSRGMRMIINPDEHVERGEKESVAAYARRNGWLVERIPDREEPGFPGISSRVYGIRKNKPR